MSRQEREPRKVLAITPIAAQDERDKFNGVCRYIAARRTDWELQILRSALTTSLLSSQLDMKIDGVIFDCTTDDPNALAVLAACRHPLVVFANDDMEPFASRSAPTAFIASDETAIGHRAADYLMEQGAMPPSPTSAMPKSANGRLCAAPSSPSGFHSVSSPPIRT